MIIHYNIPFSGNCKLAKTYCKLVHAMLKPFSKRKLLLNYITGQMLLAVHGTQNNGLKSIN